MIRQLSLLVGSAALAATLSLTATAQEYSNGGTGPKGRGPAILTPVESFGVHPPGDTGPTGHFHHNKQTFTPYYAPLSPTPTFTRFRTTHYTNYYIGYCRHGKNGAKPTIYGSDGWGKGPMPTGDGPGPEASRYGPYTSVLRDDTVFWRMGGNGLVPYGTPRPPHGGPPDLIDMIQTTRKQGGPSGPSAGCCSSTAAPTVAAGPAIMAPAE
jgi:hypothetical protein